MEEQVFDLSFPLEAASWNGKIGNYEIFSAMSRIVPLVHNKYNSILIHPFKGKTPPRFLVVRCPGVLIQEVVQIAGVPMEVKHCNLKFGPPIVSAITPAKVLESKIVTFNNLRTDRPTEDATEFSEILKVSLANLSVTANFLLGSKTYLMLKGNIIVGFGVKLFNLIPRHSLLIQAKGIGGRGHIGCGFFLKKA